MNKSLIAAEIARRIPDMARDSVVNNEALILNLLNEGCKTQIDVPLISMMLRRMPVSDYSALLERIKNESQTPSPS